TGATGPNGPSTILTGRVTGIPSGNGTLFGAAVGVTANNATESNITTLSSSTTCNAQNLAVRLTASPGGTGKQYAVTLRDVTSNTSLLSAACNGAQTCNSGTVASLTAAHEISIEITRTGNPNASDVQFGWECRP